MAAAAVSCWGAGSASVETDIWEVKSSFYDENQRGAGWSQVLRDEKKLEAHTTAAGAGVAAGPNNRSADTITSVIQRKSATHRCRICIQIGASRSTFRIPTPI